MPALRTLARLAAPAALAFPLVLAGCGGDDRSASSADAGTSHTDTAHTSTHASSSSAAGTGSTSASAGASDTPGQR